MKYVILLGISFLVSCASPSNFEESDSNVDEENLKVQESVEAEPPRHQKVYYFQHKLIPNWLYESKGAFFTDLASGNGINLFKAAEEIIDYEFSSSIKIQSLEGSQAILFIFEKPNSPPNCYFAIARKLEEGYSYTTYESTMPFLGDGFVGVVGGWSSDGDHLNMGPRTYKTAEEFVGDILGKEDS